MAESNCFDLTVSSIEIDGNLNCRFYNAAGKGDVSTIEEVLRAGVPVDYIDEIDRTVLMIAAQNSRTEVIPMLLQNGANVNKQNSVGNTAMHWAAYGNKPEAIALLVEHGASVNIRNNKGEKPIDLARRRKYKAAFRMLEQF